MHRNSFDEDYEFEVSGPSTGSVGYSVSLPHQCDSWEIVGADIDLGDSPSDEYTDDYPNLPKSKEVAVRQMELFVKRAQEALEKLKLI